MKKVLKNSKMAEMLHQLRPLLSHRDKIGYVGGPELSHPHQFPHRI